VEPQVELPVTVPITVPLRTFETGFRDMHSSGTSDDRQPRHKITHTTLYALDIAQTEPVDEPGRCAQRPETAKA